MISYFKTKQEGKTNEPLSSALNITLRRKKNPQVREGNELSRTFNVIKTLAANSSNNTTFQMR